MASFAAYALDSSNSVTENLPEVSLPAHLAAKIAETRKSPDQIKAHNKMVEMNREKLVQEKIEALKEHNMNALNEVQKRKNEFLNNNVHIEGTSGMTNSKVKLPLKLQQKLEASKKSSPEEILNKQKKAEEFRQAQIMAKVTQAQKHNTEHLQEVLKRKNEFVNNNMEIEGTSTMVSKPVKLPLKLQQKLDAAALKKASAEEILNKQKKAAENREAQIMAKVTQAQKHNTEHLQEVLERKNEFVNNNMEIEGTSGMTNSKVQLPAHLQQRLETLEKKKTTAEELLAREKRVQENREKILEAKVNKLK